MLPPSEAFYTDFYPKWMAGLEGILTQLLYTSANPHLDPAAYLAAIQKFMSHLQDFYLTKSPAVHQDPMAFLNPVWLSPFESGHMWFSGWRPSTIIDLLRPDWLTEAQVEKIACLRAKVKLGEEKVQEEMMRQQLVMTGMEMGHHGASGSGGSANVVEETAVGFEKVIKVADVFRGFTIKEVLAVLSPRQSVDFLADLALCHIRNWELGKQMGSRD